MRRCYGEPATKDFTHDFVRATLEIGLDAAFGAHADALCSDTGDEEDATHLCSIADLLSQRDRYEESSQLARRSLRLLQAQGKEDAWEAINAWRLLSYSQRIQGDFAGEELSLLSAHALVAARERESTCGSEISTGLLLIVTEIYQFYEEHNLEAQCYSLRLEYPGAFEI